MTLWEVLSAIDKDVSLLKTTFRYGKGSALSKIFAYAFIKKYKWLFPETDPPFKPCDLKAGMTPTDLLAAIRKGRLEYFIQKDLAQPLREKIFIQLLESVHVNEARVLLAIKDQDLESLFPNITYDVLADAGYLPRRKPEVVPPKEEPTDTKSKEVTEKPKVQAPAVSKPRSTARRTTKKVATKTVKKTKA
jgi:hypothetical protein